MRRKTAYIFKNNIKEWRAKKGITQVELAKKAKTSQNTISSIETGQYNPTAYTAGLICRALGCTFEECFYYEEVKE